MTALFFSYVCDYCDGLKHDDVDYYRGFVVWRSKPIPAREYVFSTRGDAEKWRAIQGLEDCDIREVLSTSKFRWRKSTGSVRGLEMADHLIEIYGDRQYPRGPHRAFLVDGSG
jgi:hypothetical protein